MARINKKVDPSPDPSGEGATTILDAVEKTSTPPVFTKGIRVRCAHGYQMYNPYSQERI